MANAEGPLTQLLRTELQKQTKAELIERVIQLLLEQGKTAIVRLDHKKKRADARNSKFQSVKLLASAVYQSLQEKLGKRPSFKTFQTEFEKAFGAARWPSHEANSCTPLPVGTINDWWKKLRADLPL